MHPRIVELENYLRAADEVLQQALQGVPPALSRQQPGDGQWSVAEVLDHLALVERRFGQLLVQLIENAQQSGGQPDPDTSSIVEKIDVTVVLDRTRKVEAIESARPRRDLTVQQASLELEQARRDLIDTLRSADGIDLGSVSYAHPLFGPLSGYQWIVFLGAHERRHADQIREVLATITAHQKEIAPD